MCRLLEERLPPAVLSRVERIAEIARSRGIPAFLVGGFVRDLLLGREDRDIDVVVEGDGVAFAALLAEELGGRLRSHPEFLTAVVEHPEGFLIDVAAARTEVYRAPAALPEVRPAGLIEDLCRRDFTVNALALRLDPLGLIDEVGGRRDLEARTLRVFHNRSFLDDPTRILRGVRLGLRLGFDLSPETASLVRPEVFEPLSGSRLRAELELLLGDPELAFQGIDRLAELGLLGVLHPDLSPGRAICEARSAWGWYRQEGFSDPPVRVWLLSLMALASDLADPEALADRLLLAGEERGLLVSFQAGLERAKRTLAAPDLRIHQGVEALERLSGEEILLLMAEAGEWVRRYLLELRPFALTIRGADLVAAGYSPGPRIGEALRETRRARLDGRVQAAGELRYAVSVLEGGEGEG